MFESAVLSRTGRAHYPALHQCTTAAAAAAIIMMVIANSITLSEMANLFHLFHYFNLSSF